MSNLSRSNLLGITDRCLSIIMKEAICMDQQSARNFITCSKSAWLSEALIQYVSKLEVQVEQSHTLTGRGFIQNRIQTFPAHHPNAAERNSLRTLIIHTSGSQLSQPDLISVLRHVSTKVAKLETLLINATDDFQNPFELSVLPDMLAKLPCLTTLRLPCRFEEGLNALAPPFTALSTLDLDICAIGPSPGAPSFCSFICQSFPKLKELGITNRCWRHEEDPIVLTAPDVASLAPLEALKIGGSIVISEKALHMLLTSTSIRHLSFHLVKVEEEVEEEVEEGVPSPLPRSWSSSTLTSLCFGGFNEEFFMPVLQHLPQLRHVGIMEPISFFINHEDYMSRCLAHLAPFPSLDGKFYLLARSDDPVDPLDDSGEMVLDLYTMDNRHQQEIAERLSRCLLPLQGSRFAESITELGFDLTLLPPLVVRDLAAVFPRVKTLAWALVKYFGHHDEDGDESVTRMRVSMSLSEAASKWPSLSSIQVGSITCCSNQAPTLEEMKEALLPVMVAMQARQRPLKLTLGDLSPKLGEDGQGELRGAWMRLRNEWESWRGVSGMGPSVTMEPA